MQYLFCMNVFHGKAQLHEPFKDLLRLKSILISSRLFDLFGQVAYKYEVTNVYHFLHIP